MTEFKPYTDPTTGEWVGEYTTVLPDGEVSRKTEWFHTEDQAREFARTGKLVDDQGRTVDRDGYIILTPTLARVASQTLADVATPAGSLGVVSKVGNGFVYVNVSNLQADDVGDHRYELSKVSVNPDTVAYWRRQGYID